MGVWEFRARGWGFGACSLSLRAAIGSQLQVRPSPLMRVRIVGVDRGRGVGVHFVRVVEFVGLAVVRQLLSQLQLHIVGGQGSDVKHLKKVGKKTEAKFKCIDCVALQYPLAILGDYVLHRP